MITNLLSTKSLLRQFLVFNLFIFLILGFFTFLYLLAIEPELINKKSKKHQNIIENIKSNLVNLKIEPDVNNLENFLYKSNFILDEVDQIRFFDINKKIIVDSSIIDINKRSLFTTERIETLGINETLNQDQSKLKSKNIAVNKMPFLKDINLKLNQKFFITSENKNNNLVIHTSSVINFSDEDIIITINHNNYKHSTIMSKETKDELSKDF